MISRLGAISRLGNLLRDLRGHGSFTMKVFRIYVTIFIAVSFFSTLYFVDYQTSSEKKALESKGKTIALFLADSVRTGVFSENRDMLNEAVAGAMGQPEVLSVAVFNAGGTELLRRDRGRSGHNAEIMEFFEPVVMQKMPTSEESMYFTERDAGGEKRNIGFVKIVIDSSGMARGARDIVKQTAGLASIFIVIGSALLFFSIRRVLRPLTMLTREVRMIGEGKEIKLVSVATSDEIGRLAEAFNSMADSLKKREDEARVFEKQLRHSQKMDAVGTLARGIAHDFNNILTTVQASLYAMQKKISTDDTLYNYISRMDNSVAKAKSLIQGLLAFGRGHSSRSYPVDIASIVDNMVPTIEGMLGDEIAYRIVKPHEQLIAMADSAQIKQVFLNMVSNARDAMQAGGSLTISLERVDAAHDNRIAEEGGFVLISVKDTGHGISDEIREKIFDPFFTTKEVGKGTGLGLSIVYGIIEQHHGHIFVKSDAGEGTEFRIYLPEGDAAGKAVDYAARGTDGESSDSR